ncbi:hypothetical protein B0H21DRAFT_833848 [Amylocystis lapponica]|nr:hypothetical protein B0H21DRAFT_833848 [Amylocystis lapponica]
MGEPSRGRQTKSDSGSLRMSKARLRGMSLPRHAFRANASSDSSSQSSPLTPGKTFEDLPEVRVVGGMPSNIRDSIISSTSSSLYPPSTASDSRTESSVLPYSDSDGNGDGEHSFFPEIAQPGSPDFDADDVSYRLRLLVNNNYFLPPAHAKPSPMEVEVKVHSRDVSPNLEPSTKPALRTTSDATTVSGFVPHHAHPLPSPARVPTHKASMNRVAVVREKMEDLTAAAKEAEQELKTRGSRRTKSQSSPRETKFVDDVVDPTDAVDLPPQMENSLFAVQASAAFGLGIQDSIGAAMLAEHLPPPISPGMWSLSTGEDSWRKALLREAVSHSFNSSVDTSFASSGYHSALHSLSGPSTSPDSSAPRASSQASPPVSPSSPVHRIGQQILDDLAITAELEEHEDPVTPTLAKTPLSGINASPTGSKSVLEGDRSSWQTFKAWEPPLVPPGRAETPSETHHPLAPPPRRQPFNPLYSLSQPDLSDANTREGDTSLGSSLMASQVVRRAVSSPKLSAVHNLIASTQRTTLSITPPPASFHHRMSSRSSLAMHTLREAPSFSSYRSTMSSPRYSDDELSYATPMDTDTEHSGPRPSVTVSLVSGSQHSFSEISGLSPTASAFHDALFGSSRPHSPLSRRSYTAESLAASRAASPLGPANVSAVGPAPRGAATSPPPRVSSSLDPTILPPPPRSPAIKPLYRPSISSHASSEPHRQSPASQSAEFSREASMSHDSFIPPVPSMPLVDRRGHPSISLRIPFGYTPQTIQSAPGPASPTAFFDTIQTQPNAMDDLDTSDESDSDEEEDSPPAPVTTFPEPRTPTVESSSHRSRSRSSTSSRPSFMRLGNHSTPYFSPAQSLADDAPPVEFDPRKPIANVPDLPPRGNFFSTRNKGIGHADSHLLPFRPVSSPQPQSSGSGVTRSSSLRRPATAAAESGRRWQRESLQKFDGMLLQHMEAERDRFKQIASNISSAKS